MGGSPWYIWNTMPWVSSKYTVPVEGLARSGVTGDARRVGSEVRRESENQSADQPEAVGGQSVLRQQRRGARRGFRAFRLDDDD